jgi:hypothetical protein
VVANYYYITNRTGTGVTGDPYVPDVDAGTSYVNQIGTDNKCIVLVDRLQTAKAGRIQLPPIQQLSDACAARGINLNDVLNKWSIG